jgi:hypothetical protein
LPERLKGEESRTKAENKLVFHSLVFALRCRPTRKWIQESKPTGGRRAENAGLPQAAVPEKLTRRNQGDRLRMKLDRCHP